MSKYDITYECGHDGRVTIIGSKRTREQIAERESRKLCPECYSAKLAADRAAASAAAADQAKAAGLPALTGSEKQIAWAETIRAKAVAQLDKLSAYLDDIETDPDATERDREEARVGRDVIAKTLSNTDAHSWIESQSTRYSDWWLMKQTQRAMAAK